MDITTRRSIAEEIGTLVPRLRQFAHGLCGDRDRADDLVQSACLKALDRIDQFTPGTRLDGWMYRIVETTFLDDLRKTRRQGPHTASDDPVTLSDRGWSAKRCEQRADLTRAKRALADLPSDQRTVMVLVAIMGLTYRETADVLSIPVGTVMSRLARARSRMVDAVQQVSGRQR